ncbi:MAG: purine-binding chemotaxis protein CheW [Gammaproteobacteria bacterium]|nr:MAG: purine-binding chemotaxis protein CheW [Gammaproteobacteria bacterium]
MEMKAQEATATERGAQQYLGFVLGEDAFGIDILRVQEIRGWEPVRALPETSAHVKGVLDLRGTIVPIVDLRIRFGAVDPVYEPTTVIVIAVVEAGAAGRQLVGMVVDAVTGVIDATEAEIKSPPAMVGGVSSQYLRGMVSQGEQMTVLLDVDRIFSEEEWARLDSLA